RTLRSSRCGPSHNFRITSTSAWVNEPQSPDEAPMRALGSYVHRLGSSMTPSFTPSIASQAAIAAAVAAAHLHPGPGFPATLIGNVPHIDCIMSLGQLIAGAPDTMPSYSCG